jgi:hypothetical protein
VSHESDASSRNGPARGIGKATRSGGADVPDADFAAADPNPPARLGAGALVFAVVSIGLTVLLSAVPWSPVDASRAIIRLSWRATGTQIEECRRPTDDENARLPAHMRREEICEGRPVLFLLEVSVDGRTVVRDTVEPAGARGDRPVYILRDVEVEPGLHDVLVTFDTRLPGDAGDTAAGSNGFPKYLRLESRVEVGLGEVALITYDGERRTLVERR